MPNLLAIVIAAGVASVITIWAITGHLWPVIPIATAIYVFKLGRDFDSKK